jgi:2'-5' RNA ligase
MPGPYSIWLLPDRETTAHRRLDDLIADHARAHPDAPEFDPHITLLGGIETDEKTVGDRTRDLTRGRDPLELAFGGVSCSTTTHQCVFLLVWPSVPLLELRQAATESFGRAAEMYVPHVSLIYSALSPEDRVRMVRSIDADSLPDTVPIDAVEIVDTGGPVSDWQTVSTYTL